MDVIARIPRALRSMLHGEDPGELLYGLPLWVVVIYTAALIVKYTRFLFTYERVYQSHSARDRKTFNLILQVANDAKLCCVLGIQMVETHKVPTMMVSVYPLFVMWTETSHVGMYGQTSSKATILRLRGTEPLVPDPVPKPVVAATNNVVEVFTANNNGVKSEIAVSRLVPQEQLPHIKAIVDDIIAFRSDPTMCEGSCVFIIHGTPGSGKSTVGRMLARTLDAVLYPDYDLTNNLHNLQGFFVDYGDEKIFVVVLEEFDCILRKIVEGIPPATVNQRSQPDATNKKEWNAFLDGVHRIPNAIVILTTNLTPDELLHDVCKGDTSLLRKGRIDGTVELSLHRPTEESCTSSNSSLAFSSSSMSTSSASSSSRLRTKGMSARPIWR